MMFVPCPRDDDVIKSLWENVERPANMTRLYVPTSWYRGLTGLLDHPTRMRNSLALLAACAASASAFAPIGYAYDAQT